jgi:hypothetical protein
MFLYFFFYRIGEESRTGWGTGGRRGSGGERGRRMNMVQIMYAHISKCKNDIC